MNSGRLSPGVIEPNAPHESEKVIGFVNPSNRLASSYIRSNFCDRNLTAKNQYRFSLGVAFAPQKPSAKLLNDAFYAMLCRQIEKLRRSDHPAGNFKRQARSLPAL